MNHKTTIKIYEVNNEYINILANIDKEVRFAKKSFRPYLFTKILLAQNKEYLIPFSSPKNLKKRSRDITDRIYDVDDPTRLIGFLEYHKMIPFHERIAKLVDIKEYPNHQYRALLEKDYKYLESFIGIESITRKASRIYKARYDLNHYLYKKYLCKIGNDYRLLENTLENYIQTLINIQQTKDD